MSVLVTLGLAHLSMMIECIIFMILFQSLQPAPQGIALALTPITNANVYTAANLWVSNEAQARSEYGDISEWDVSAVTSLGFSKSGGCTPLVRLTIVLTLIFSYCSVCRCLKLQRRLEQVGHVESDDTGRQ